LFLITVVRFDAMTFWFDIKYWVIIFSLHGGKTFRRFSDNVMRETVVVQRLDKC
jgi:hypothetical protein